MFSGDEAARTAKLILQTRRLAAVGIDLLQLREKDLAPAELVTLARRIGAELRIAGTTRLLVNCGSLGRLQGPPVKTLADEILSLLRESGAFGVHLPSDWTPELLEAIRQRESNSKAYAAQLNLGRSPSFRTTPDPANARSPESAVPLVSVACHTAERCEAASRAGASLILFSPVREWRISATGMCSVFNLERLGDAVRAASPTPVLGLGGLTQDDAAECLRVGAAGVAGIRLFSGGPSDSPITPPTQTCR